MSRTSNRKSSVRKDWEKNKNQRRKQYQRKRASWSEFWNAVSHNSQLATDGHIQRRQRPNSRLRRASRGEKRHFNNAAAVAPSSFFGVLKDWMNWTWGVFFFLLSYVVGSALFFKFREEAQTGFFLQPSMICFFVGSIIWAAVFYLKVLERAFLYVYVFGHEFTHAFFVWIFLGRISDIAITSEGGYVQTRRSNFLIALSPYFVPFLGILFVGLFLLVRLFVNIPYENYILYSIVGFTWAFHMLWTHDMLMRGQSDLDECGPFMSIGIITFFNILLLSLMVCLATTSWLDLFSYSLNTWNHLWGNAMEFLTNSFQ